MLISKRCSLPERGQLCHKKTTTEGLPYPLRLPTFKTTKRRGRIAAHARNAGGRIRRQTNGQTYREIDRQTDNKAEQVPSERNKAVGRRRPRKPRSRSRLRGVFSVASPAVQHTDARRGSPPAGARTVRTFCACSCIFFTSSGESCGGAAGAICSKKTKAATHAHTHARMCARTGSREKV